MHAILKAAPSQSSSAIWGKRSQQQNDTLQHLAKKRAFGAPLIAMGIEIPISSVDQFHNGANGGIKIKTFLDIHSYFFNGKMQSPLQFFLFLAQGRHLLRRLDCFRLPGKEIHVLLEKAPDTAQETVAALHTLLIPVQIPFGGSGKKDKKPPCIGTIAFDNLIGSNNITQRLGHFGAILIDHALSQEALERLLNFYQALIKKKFGEKTGIKQMQHGMLYTPDILVNRQPVINLLFTERSLLLARIRIAQIVPGRTKESIHGIRFPPGRAPALRAAGLHKIFAFQQR